MSGSDSTVADIRRFNRFYTQRLGVLQEAWLDSPYSLTEARVLYELCTHDILTATRIGSELGLLERALEHVRVWDRHFTPGFHGSSFSR